jgi:tripartite-type tricarboxylate transporter receptor subunit TctC
VHRRSLILGETLRDLLAPGNAAKRNPASSFCEVRRAALPLPPLRCHTLAKRFAALTRHREEIVRIFLALLAAITLAPNAWAQDAAANYPNRPIHIIVCVPAGGGVDTVTRIVANGLQEKLVQPVVVENRSGAAGNIGAEAVYTSEPDGYTLLAAQPSPLTVNPLLYKKMSFDPTQFEPVAIMTTVANVLLVRPDFPAKTAQEFIAYAKANPGKINYASQGIGTTSHLTAALFEKVTGTKLVHVPYKGTAPALNDLIAGHVDMIFMELASALKLHQAGKARILAVATSARIPTLPDIPTLDEAGVKGFESGTWNAIAAPPKTPAAIVAKLNAAVNAVLASKDVQDKFAKLNLHAAGGTTADAAAFIKKETQTWGDVIKEAHVPGH